MLSFVNGTLFCDFARDLRLALTKEGAAVAYQSSDVARTELEQSAARRRKQPSPGIAGRSESLRNKQVRVVHGANPQGNGWRCNACPGIRALLQHLEHLEWQLDEFVIRTKEPKHTEA
jgi:hypothetical protein